MRSKGDKITPMEILERVVILEQGMKAWHRRIDDHEKAMRESVERQEAQVKEILTDVKALTASMNVGKGWAAAAMLGASIIGGTIASVFGK